MLVAWFGLGSVDSSFSCLMLIVWFGFSGHFSCLMLVVLFGLGSFQQTADNRQQFFVFRFCFVSAAADSRQQTTDNEQQTTDIKQQIADSRILVIRMKRKDGWRSESSGNDL